MLLTLLLLAPTLQTGLQPERDEPIPAFRRLWPSAAQVDTVGYRDLDGDGDPDLVVYERVSSLDGWLVTLLNDGAGRFAPYPHWTDKVVGSFGFEAGSGEGGFVLGDVDGDGFDDIVSLEGGVVPSWIAVRAGAGDGTFGADQSYSIDGSLPSGPGVGSSKGFELAVADFDGDGADEIAVAGRYDELGPVVFGARIHVRVWDLVGGALASSPELVVTRPLEAAPLDLIFPVDLDGDQRFELVLRPASCPAPGPVSVGIEIYEWASGSGLAPAAAFATAPPFAADVRIDWDLDGDVDFARFDDDGAPPIDAMQVLRNRIGEGAATSWELVTVASPLAAEGVDLSAFECSHSTATGGDLDGDGVLELATFLWGPGFEPRATRFEWDAGLGAWEVEYGLSVSTPVWLMSGFGAMDDHFPMGHVDLDGNGTLERLAGFYGLFGEAETWHSNLPAIPLGYDLLTGGAPPLETIGYDGLLAFDRDGDGDDDLFFSTVAGATAAGEDLHGRFLANDGRGGFDLADLPLPGAPAGTVFAQPFVALRDFDGDGRRDLLVPRVDAATGSVLGLSLLAGGPGGSYVDRGDVGLAAADVDALVAEAPSLFGSPQLDLNGDGTCDLVASAASFLFDGSGPTAVPVPLAGGARYEIADVDGDGLGEVVAVELSDRIVVRDPTFSGPAALALGGVTESLVYQHSTPAYAAPSGAPPAAVQSLAVADLDGDGQVEIVVHAVDPVDLPIAPSLADDLGLGATLEVLDRDGTGTWVRHARATSWVGRLGTGDLDGDGVEEVLASLGAASFFNGRLAVVATDGAGGFEVTEFELGFRMPPDFIGRRILTVDGDGDGDADVVGLDRIFEAVTWDGADKGLRAQYGEGFGPSSPAPILGASGPLRPGSTTAALRLVRGPGGAPAFVAVGATAASVPDFLFPGVDLWIAPIATVLPGVLSGAPFEAGAGAWSIDLTPFLPSASGLSMTLQALLVDPFSPAGFTTTNGLALAFGQ